MITIATWLQSAKTRIDILDAELILCRTLKVDERSYLTAHGEQTLTSLQTLRANKMLRKRRAGVPLAYILGYKEFYGRRFKVNRHTLIPRPESEAIIHLALSLHPNKILELGTGSGCLGITLSAELGLSAKITCTDISHRALSAAFMNGYRIFKDDAADRKLTFRNSDLLENIPRPNSFDLIIANLPYVDKTWDWLDLKALSYEPQKALFADEHGLALYKKLFEQLKTRRIKTPLILEADPCQHAELKEIAKTAGYHTKKTDGFAILFVNN